MDRLVGYLRRLRRALRTWFKGPYPAEWQRVARQQAGFAFPIPRHPRKNKRKVQVNRLGIRYYKRREFPEWVNWDHNDPNSLYINSKLLAIIIAKELGLPGADNVLQQAAFCIGSRYLRDNHVGDYKIKPLNSSLDLKSDLDMWFTKEQLNNIKDF